MSKKPSETSESLHKDGARLPPSATSPDWKGKVTIFMGTLLSTDYDKLIGHAGASFANLVQIGEIIEDSLLRLKNKGLSDTV